jgi:hypothetical protein
MLLLSCSGSTAESSGRSSIDTVPNTMHWADAYVPQYLEKNRDRLMQVDGHPVTYHKEIFEYDVINDSLILWKANSENDQLADTIPPDGTYRFDVAFAEWEGKSMGEKVTVVIKGDSIKVVYEGDGNLTNAKKGDVLDQGKIMKHKTGVWIIGKSKSDAQVDKIGGCSGGPTIVDFKSRKYWMC